MPVSIFAGEVCRSWKFEDREGVKHEVSLWHHPLTGARAAMIDHEEMEGSLGTTSVLHAAVTSMPFEAGSAHGVLSIRRTSFSGFEYSCSVDGILVPEATTAQSNQDIPQYATRFNPSEDEIQTASYTSRVESYATTRDHTQPTTAISWYGVATFETRSGRELTRVHRRFRDFAELDESVQAAFAGHHMLSSIPPLPSKRFKLVQDHLDSSFLESRKHELDDYVRRLCAVPRVWATPAMKPFFGLADGAREYSIIFTQRKLGFTVGKCGPKKSPEAGDAVYEPPDFPAFVASIIPPESQPYASQQPFIQSQQQHQVPQVGDLVSKISGRATCNLPFKSIVTAIRDSSRPIILHFIGSGTRISGSSSNSKNKAGHPQTPVVTAAAPPPPPPPGSLAPPPGQPSNPVSSSYTDSDPFSSATPYYPPPPSSNRAFARLPQSTQSQPWGHTTAAERHARNDLSNRQTTNDAAIAAAERSLFEDPQPRRHLPTEPPSAINDHNLFVDDNPFSTPDETTITL